MCILSYHRLAGAAARLVLAVGGKFGKMKGVVARQIYQACDAYVKRLDGIEMQSYTEARVSNNKWAGIASSTQRQASESASPWSRANDMAARDLKAAMLAGISVDEASWRRLPRVFYAATL